MPASSPQSIQLACKRWPDRSSCYERLAPFPQCAESSVANPRACVKLAEYKQWKARKQSKGAKNKPPPPLSPPPPSPSSPVDVTYFTTMVKLSSGMSIERMRMLTQAHHVRFRDRIVQIDLPPKELQQRIPFHRHDANEDESVATQTVAFAKELVAAGLFDRWRFVDYSPTVLERIAVRAGWPTRARATSYASYTHYAKVWQQQKPLVGVYSYFAALDLCDSTHLLWTDLDVVFWSMPQASWVVDGANLLAANPSMLSVVPPAPERGSAVVGSSRHLLIHKPRLLAVMAARPCAANRTCTCPFGRQKQPSSGNPCDNLLDGDGAPGIIGRGRVGPQWAGKFEWLTLKRSHGGALTNGSRYWALHMPYLPSWQTTPCMLAMISSGVGVQDKSNVGDAATRESWLRHPICEESSGYIV